MFQKLILSLLFLSIADAAIAQGFDTPYEQSKGLRSTTYKQLISFYDRLDDRFKTIRMDEAGPTDAYYPLHVVYYSNDGDFDIKNWKDHNKTIILINNGIHPGEPDGIDASMMLLRDAAMNRITIPDNIVLAVIPVFNIGGMLNRASYSRANQNGPEAYGFRGSAQNLDLNRDFMKEDAKETRSLIELFHRLDPDIFIDNHVSNGADYQHIMTLLATQHNKLGGSMGTYLHNVMEPLVYKQMKQEGYSLVPYVNHWGHTPERGWIAFHEGPRFASGFAALFQTYAFVPETHMLKPFAQRVEATYTLMKAFIAIASQHAGEIKNTRIQDRRAIKQQHLFTIEWMPDTTKADTITFMGYAAGYKPSKVSGLPRLYYDRDKPYTKEIVYHNYYMPRQQVVAPKAYIIPHGWSKVINRLRWNGVKMVQLNKDTTLEVKASYIENYETSPKPYEGHYLHSKIKTRDIVQSIKLLKGDYIVSTDQAARRYIIEALEPAAPDGFFAWGFFDAVLQQKEYFSDYVFEDEAAALLSSNADLRSKLKARQLSDTAFAKDSEAQLDFIYRSSAYYEPGHMRYPVFRLE